MKRPIKFRGRVTANFEHGMHKGKLICGCLWDMGNNHKKGFSWSSRYNINAGDGYGYYPVDENSIAQLVGYDRNGKEVYEGDTVEFNSSRPGEPSRMNTATLGLRPEIYADDVDRSKKMLRYKLKENPDEKTD